MRVHIGPFLFILVVIPHIANDETKIYSVLIFYSLYCYIIEILVFIHEVTHSKLILGLQVINYPDQLPVHHNFPHFIWQPDVLVFGKALLSVVIFSPDDYIFMLIVVCLNMVVKGGCTGNIILIASLYAFLSLTHFSR